MSRPRSIQLLAAVAAGVLVLSACGAADGTGDDPNIVGSWELISGTGLEAEFAPVEGHPITLDIGEDGQVSGNDGCNQLSSTVTINGNEVKFSPIAGTLMACAEDVMDVAQMFNATLQAVTAAEETNGQLVLSGADIELLFSATSGN